MICTRLLSPIKNQEDYDILPILDLGDFVIYKKIAKSPFYNSIDYESYISNEETQYNFYFEESLYFICSYELFYSQFNKDAVFIKNITANKKISYFKLKQLKKIREIINNDGKGGTLITFKYKENNFWPFYVFCDQEIAEKEFKYLLETVYKCDVNANIKLHENYFIKIKTANDAFLSKESSVYHYVHNIIGINIEKAIYDLESIN
ncbi:hypothetical protein [Mycoplasma sp. 3398]